MCIPWHEYHAYDQFNHFTHNYLLFSSRIIKFPSSLLPSSQMIRVQIIMYNFVFRTVLELYMHEATRSTSSRRAYLCIPTNEIL
jgi:hypothetical protein